MAKKIKNANTNGFTKNPQNINKKGRPPKLIKATMEKLKSQGYERVSSDEIVEAYAILLQMDEQTLKEFVSDKTNPLFLRTVGRELLSKKGFEVGEIVLNRIHGRPTQKIESKQEINQGIKVNVIDNETESELNKLSE